MIRMLAQQAQLRFDAWDRGQSIGPALYNANRRASRQFGGPNWVESRQSASTAVWEQLGSLWLGKGSFRLRRRDLIMADDGAQPNRSQI